MISEPRKNGLPLALLIPCLILPWATHDLRVLRDLMPRKAHVSLNEYLPSGLTFGLADVIIFTFNDFTFKCTCKDKPCCEKVTWVPDPSAYGHSSCCNKQECLPCLVDSLDWFSTHDWYTFNWYNFQIGASDYIPTAGGCALKLNLKYYGTFLER